MNLYSVFLKCTLFCLLFLTSCKTTQKITFIGSATGNKIIPQEVLLDNKPVKVLANGTAKISKKMAMKELKIVYENKNNRKNIFSIVYDTIYLPDSVRVSLDIIKDGVKNVKNKRPIIKSNDLYLEQSEIVKDNLYPEKTIEISVFDELQKPVKDAHITVITKNKEIVHNDIKTDNNGQATTSIIENCKVIIEKKDYEISEEPILPKQNTTYVYLKPKLFYIALQLPECSNLKDLSIDGTRIAINTNEYPLKKGFHTIECDCFNCSYIYTFILNQDKTIIKNNFYKLTLYSPCK